jgi:hypothetical protein
VLALAWGLFFFLALQALPLFLLERVWPEQRDPEYYVRLRQLREQWGKDGDRRLAVLLGSSRVAAGFRLGELPPREADGGAAPLVFDFGQLGAGPRMQLVWLRRLLADGVRPDRVFVEYWPAYCAEGIAGNEEERIRVETLTHAEVAALERHCTGKGALSQAWRARRLWPTPCRVNRQVLGPWLPSIIAPAPPDRNPGLELWMKYDPWGCSAPFVALEDLPPIAPDRVRPAYEARTTGYRRTEAVAAVYREIWAVCRENHVHPHLYVLPEGPAFRSWYSADAQAEIAAFLDEVRADGVPVTDARDWCAEKDFIDSAHLMTHGAITLTRRFGQEVLGLAAMPADAHGPVVRAGR